MPTSRTEQVLSYEDLRRQTEVLSAVNDILWAAMQHEKAEGFGKACLDVICSKTNYQAGIIVEIDSNYEMADIAHNVYCDEKCTDQSLFCVLPMIHALCDIVLKSGISFSTNRPMDYICKTDDSNASIAAFLGVPFFKENKVAGIIALLNWIGCYEQEDKDTVETLVPTIFDLMLKKCKEKFKKDNEILVQTIMDSAVDFLFIKNRDSRVVMVNKAYEAAFGIKIDDVIGKNDYELYPDSKMARQVIENDQQVMNAGKTQIFEESALTPWGYKTYSLSKVPWRDSNGNIIGVLGIGHDITELKKRESELKATRQDLAKEVEALNKLHMISCRYIRRDNTRQIYNEMLDAAIGLTQAEKGIVLFFDEVAGSFKTIAKCGFEESFLQHFEKITYSLYFCERKGLGIERTIIKDVENGPFLCEMPGKTLLLNENIHSMQWSPMISSSGKLVGFLCTQYRSSHIFKSRELRMLDLLSRQAADVIERIEIENDLQQTKNKALLLVEELKNADRSKNEFISALSHELRNPLATIMAGLSLFDLTSDKAQTVKAKEIIHRQVDHLCKLVDDLLDLTRVIHNKIELRKREMELNHISLQALEAYKALFNEKGVALSADLYNEDLYINADHVRITQIIGNLLSNALKFSKKGDDVKLSVHRNKNDAIICVKDQGIGIAPSFMDKLFEPFMQADNSLDRHNSGLGLGLSIVKCIAELHGGSVRAFSNGIGTGSEFMIVLPIVGDMME